MADTGSDPTKADTDGDGFDDFFEANKGSDPNSADSVPILTILRGEYFIGEDPGEGNGTAFTASDGGFESEAEETASVELDVSSLEVGMYQLGVRYKDNLGNWGPVQWKSFEIFNPNEVIEESSFITVVAGEYFIGEDPGEGQRDCVCCAGWCI